ncbi:hypothetical protein CN307_29595 [Bacillus cereus]|uniref:Uncharacterized protein n=1 Tax=Bacillus cereus TaxID=1396 RepID=A0A2A8ZU34_BACCE|nr:hypothetical protein CN307_29595 [Bacillus cereus]
MGELFLYEGGFHSDLLRSIWSPPSVIDLAVFFILQNRGGKYIEEMYATFGSVASNDLTSRTYPEF